MDEDDLKWLDTKKRKGMLIRLSYKKKFMNTLHQLAIEIDVFPSGIDVQKLFRILIDNDILCFEQKVYFRNLYKIEIKKLCAIIQQLPSYIEQESYKAYTH